MSTSHDYSGQPIVQGLTHGAKVILAGSLASQGHPLDLLVVDLIKWDSGAGQCHLPLVVSVEVLGRVYHVCRGHLLLLLGLGSFGRHYNAS